MRDSPCLASMRPGRTERRVASIACLDAPARGLLHLSLRACMNGRGGEETMNQDILEGKWTQLKGRVKEQWGKLTDDDLDQINGKAEQLVGKLQERYGLARDDAQRQVDALVRDDERARTAGR
jgi:uncharacterized protein YjbJ (UPF0337 family)